MATANRRLSNRLCVSLCISAVAAPVAALAGPATEPTSDPATEPASAGASAEVNSTERFTPRGNPENRDKWIYRWAPEPNMGELGVFGGIWIPSKHLELFAPNPDLPGDGWQRLARVTPEIGVRAGYYPFRFFGVEAEGAVLPSRTQTTDARATAWTLRAHVIGQIGLWSITPFLLAGTGLVGVASDDAPQGLGRDQDVTIHFGGGAKFYINRSIQLRLDIRDVVSNRRGVGEGLTSSPEVLLGLTWTFGRKKDRRQRITQNDRDGDGIIDDNDYCPDVFGVAPRGCPQVCIDDNDGDGLSNPVDKCPNEPETRNGYQDKDGCPDEVPPALTDLAGVMEGINFDTDKATIRSGSRERLDNAVKVMTKYKEIRVEVIGHTDTQGGYRHNVDLSTRRAAAVRQYLLDNGIEASRVETQGVGPDQPLDTNETTSGRAKNRRIEFRIIEQDAK